MRFLLTVIERNLPKPSLIIAFIMMFGLFKASASPENEFWNWFEKNENRLFTFETDRDRVFDEIAGKMKNVHESVTFEFGPVVDGKREFVISADGIKDAFPAVEKLYESAPKLSRWKFIKFRPRRVPMDINYGGVKVKKADVFCTVEPDGNKAGVTVYIRGYQDRLKNQYTAIAFLMLDQALGEYDVETKVGFIEVHDFAKPSKLEKKPLADVTQVFDAFWKYKTDGERSSPK
jgi:hypothetical protein